LKTLKNHKKMRKAKIYLSDEGYGHIVRQQAIIEQLQFQSNNNIDFTLQTHKHIDAAKRIINNVNFIDKYNNISWFKHPNGSPDIDKIKDYFSSYQKKSINYINQELTLDVDFIISDFVYESFEIAKLNNIPSFGVAHFTWDWFFSKLYPPPISSKILSRFFSQSKDAKAIYFPFFTPQEILNYYKNAVEVPLIVRSNSLKKNVNSNGKFNVLIMDSGSGVLKESIESALRNISELDDIQFFVSRYSNSYLSNLTIISEDDLLVDYIGEMDLVIGRAGFNTISECIALRTPMLLLGEAMNPEINENIVNLKKAGLASFMSLSDFKSGLKVFLASFLKNEYKVLKHNMENHDIKINGAEIIAKDILKYL
tara:strand:- start:674 stop:1777 length:1104 start_codon:yes stop_codon:yes gene_type:complete